MVCVMRFGRGEWSQCRRETSVEEESQSRREENSGTRNRGAEQGSRRRREKARLRVASFQPREKSHTHTHTHSTHQRWWRREHIKEKRRATRAMSACSRVHEHTHTSPPPLQPSAPSRLPEVRNPARAPAKVAVRGAQTRALQQESVCACWLKPVYVCVCVCVDVHNCKIKAEKRRHGNTEQKVEESGRGVGRRLGRGAGGGRASHQSGARSDCCRSR